MVNNIQHANAVSQGIGLIGQGTIYQKVKCHLESTHQIILLQADSSDSQFSDCKIVVCCSDTWSPQALQKINRRCLRSGVALLPVYTYFAEGVIGPCVVPQQKGCTRCAEWRKLGAISAEAERQLFLHYLTTERGSLPEQRWLSTFSLEILAALVKEEILTYMHNAGQLQTECAFLSIALETLVLRRHTFFPLPSCPDCGELANDAAEAAVIALQSCPKPNANTYRSQQYTVSEEQLRSTYVDEQAGLIYALSTDSNDLLPMSTSLMYDELRAHGEIVPGSGCALTVGQSKIVSMLEAVERYAGIRPRGKCTVVHASYHQLMEQNLTVLDPTTLGLHSQEQYEYYKRQYCCSHHLTAYHHDLACNWVWGYSFQRQSPMLVPEHYAYYGLPLSQENPAFAYDVSNGCALGTCLEEAIFHGMTEVIERDAFLLTWYARLGLPRLDLSTITDPSIRMAIKHIEYHSGYSIHAWNATLNHSVPCFYLLAVDEQNREQMPKVHVAAGSHPHPEQALARALRELTMALISAPQVYEQRKAEAREMLANSQLVNSMYDHALVYYLPEAFERLSFLYHTQPRQSFVEAFRDFYQHPPTQMDLRDNLVSLINDYLEQGIDTIVVDQTAPEYAPCHLRCVKVIMPGMLPMTFGQNNYRLVGLERLYQLPYTLGYRGHPLTQADLNPYPHPFP